MNKRFLIFVFFVFLFAAGKQYSAAQCVDHRDVPVTSGGWIDSAGTSQCAGSLVDDGSGVGTLHCNLSIRPVKGSKTEQRQMYDPGLIDPIEPFVFLWRSEWENILRPIDFQRTTRRIFHGIQVGEEMLG